MSPSQSAISQCGWGFHTVRGGIDQEDNVDCFATKSGQPILSYDSSNDSCTVAFKTLPFATINFVAKGSVMTATVQLS